MFPSLLEFLMGAAYIIIFGCMTAFAFEIFRDRLPLFDPGALIGFGGLGCIGLLGFQWGYWDWISAIILCFLGGCMVSGIFRWGPREQPNDNGQRAVGNGQRAVGW